MAGEQYEIYQQGTAAALAEWTLDALDTKADVDGYYQQLTAGAADNLTGRGDATGGEYLFRTTAGTASVSDEGVATVKSIKGRTLQWNQLAPDPDSELWTATNITPTVSDGVITLTPTSSAATYRRLRCTVGACVVGHKHLIAFDADTTNLASGHTATVGLYETNGLGTNRGGIQVQAGVAKAHYAQIVTPTTGTGLAPTIAISAAADDTESATFEDVICIDLTQMFGTGSEPSTVAEFEALYPLPYYPYDAGSLLPVNMTGISTNGFNQWDEEWEVGGISSSTGQNAVDSSVIRSTNYIPVFPSTEYYVRMSGAVNVIYAFVYWYDADKGFISVLNTATSRVVTSPSNARYMRFRMSASYGTTYNHDICVNLSWSGYRNGEHEPYWTAQRLIDVATYFPNGMRSAGTVYDELTETQAITRIGERAYQSGDESDATVVTDGTVTHYALAEPTIVTIDPPLNTDYRYADFGTERIIVPTGEMSAPPTLETVYGINATDTIRNLPTDYTSKKSLENLLAALDAHNGTTTTMQWNEGQQAYSFTIADNETEG